jgi:uncharacterized membrane protein
MIPALLGTCLLNAQHTNNAIILPILFLGVMVLFGLFYFFAYVQGGKGV